VYVSLGQRYRSEPFSKFSFGWRWEGEHIGSAQVYPAITDNTGTVCLIMETTSATVKVTEFGGRGVQISRVGMSAQLQAPVNVASLDPTMTWGLFPPHSVLLVNVNRPGRLQFAQSIRPIVDQQWPAMRARFLSADPGLRIHQGPRVSWVWHEQDIQFLQPRRPYVRLEVVLTWNPSGMADLFFGEYKITIWMYLDFRIQNGLVVQAVRYQYWVSSGHLAQYVGTIADLATQLAIWELNNVGLPQAVAQVNQAIQNLNRAPTDVFLLPGNQAPGGVNGLIGFGNNAAVVDAYTDATVVLELM
jgi:hypothetical protein